jgi:S1-C subfamily serine protease
MKWLLVAVASLAASAASYAGAESPEGLLGTPMHREAGRAGAALPAGVKAPAGTPSGATAYGKALRGLKPDGPAVTRGAKESHVYQAASPSVVLIVTKDALGSGVLVDALGRIVTNLHVVGDNKEVGVIFKPRVEGAAVGDADMHRARVIRRDEVADLALIEVTEIPAGVKPLAIAGATAVQVGSDVHAIGHPTGETWSYTRGIVSQIRRDYDWNAEDKIPHTATVIQTQTPINPGNSGGPLLDDNLEIVGINSFTGEGEGLNFAVSAEDVKAFLARPNDRLVAKAAKKAVADKTCKSKAIDERPSKDPVGTEYAMDSDCDGKGDYVMIVPDRKRDPLIVMLDDDGDGKLDTVIFDTNQDGHPDYSLYDTDGNGKPDLEGKYRMGEDEPYRLEKIAEK